MPLPHISGSLPSLLKMRIRASARSEGRARISPSAPMPKCLSHSFFASVEGSFMY